MNKIIYLELLAFFREKFKNTFLTKLIILISLSYLLFGYALSIFFNSWIINNFDNIYKLLWFFGIISGISLSNRELLLFLRSIPKIYKLFPYSYSKLIFIKTIKYEFFNLIVFMLLITIISFPLIINVNSFKSIIVIFESILLFLCINKSKELIKIIFIHHKIKGFKILWKVLLETIMFLYFMYLFNRQTAYPFIKSIKINTLIINENIQVKVVILSLMIYVISYWLLIYTAIKVHAYTKKTTVVKLYFSSKNILYTKIFREIFSNTTTNITSELISLPITFLIIKVLQVVGIIDYQMKFAIVLSVLLMSQTALIVSFISTNLLTDSQSIKVIIQSKLDIRTYLLRKSAVIYFFSLINIILSTIVLFLTKLIDFNSFILLSIILTINAVPLVIMSQTTSNFIVRYLSKESFENSLSLPISLTTVYIYTMIQTLIIFMANILHVTTFITIVILSIYIFISSITFFILFILMRKNYYGEFRKFIR